ncbi:MAG: ABC transporter ATP-binding protein [Deltaproteobacteria bacterium]|nr:ABC transporter ATP-binding protein [Deltaproteobacteria bacterium]
MIRLEDLNTHLLEFDLRDINLGIEENEFFILMGPTGAGKTVLLEAIAGLVPVKSGKILIGKKEITKLPPEKRGISIVYQDYALFPHLTVLENITYGLHFHRLDKTQAEKRLHRLIEELNLSHLQQRLPTNLSGGEKQRVALARALMIEPMVLLLDEPLSALDPGFREEIRNALKRLHQSSNTTFLMVTHDFAEALSLAGRAAVMNNGRIEQVGHIEDIFQRPSSTFVADFVGMKNLFAAEFRGTKAIIHNLEVELGTEPTNSHGYIAIRPEDIVISREELTSSMRNSFRGTVTGVVDQGFYYEVHVRVGQVTFKSLITKRSLFELDVHEGVAVVLSFKSTAIHNF